MVHKGPSIAPPPQKKFTHSFEKADAVEKKSHFDDSKHNSNARTHTHTHTHRPAKP